MHLLYSTDTLPSANRFKVWRDLLSERYGEFEFTRIDDRAFTSKIEATKIGSLPLARITQSAAEQTSRRRPRSYDLDTALAIFKLAGATSGTIQDDRAAVQRPGELVVLTRRPSVLGTPDDGQSLLIELPRARLESVLGPSNLYTSLTIGAELASTTLALTYFRELIQVEGQLSADAAERMSSIGIDLIVASIAERMAKDVPRPLHSSLVVQRAKAHVETNLHDRTLDPPRLAAAMGVSLRRLQELFHERGQHISDWIWERRLTMAAKRLADPACLHLPIGTLAYECGFTSQAHFSRRFKHRYGYSPGEHRRVAQRPM
ncbi:helix-turn-helix domain-containing protein [Methylobacterium sp. A49B]